jgi:predicted outer membrane protein
MTEQQRLVRDLASTINADPKEVGVAVALARTGRTDLITAVMAGRIDVRAALQAARRSTKPSVARSEPRAANSL